jgi:hypothetical protein
MGFSLSNMAVPHIIAFKAFMTTELTRADNAHRQLGDAFRRKKRGRKWLEYLHVFFRRRGERQ